MTQRKVTKCRWPRWQVWASLEASPLGLLLHVVCCAEGPGGDKTCQHRGRWEGRSSEAQGPKEMEPNRVVCLLRGWMTPQDQGLPNGAPGPSPAHHCFFV